VSSCTNPRLVKSFCQKRARPQATACVGTFRASGLQRPSSQAPSGRKVRRDAREVCVARWYDPGTGEFLSVDPDLAETDQPYSYAGDDPVNRTDPTGESVNETTVVTPSFRTGSNPACTSEQGLQICRLIFEQGPLDIVIPGTTMTPGADAPVPDLYLQIQDLNRADDSFTVTDEDSHKSIKWITGTKLVVIYPYPALMALMSLPIIGHKGTSPIWQFAPRNQSGGRIQDGYAIRIDAPWSALDQTTAGLNRQFLVNFAWRGPSPLSTTTAQLTSYTTELRCASVA
jgi:hypothetical protein